MNENMSMIKVTYGDNDTPTVSGRELHKALGVKTAYKDWFPRMCEYGFSEGVDFNPLIFEQVRTEGERQVVREITDHKLTIPMAKELCMLQRTDKGKQMRQYFIAVEEQWNTPEIIMSRALRMASKNIVRLEEKNAALESKIAEDAPKVEFANAVAESSSLIDIGTLAKLARDENIPIGRNRLFDWLRQHKYIMDREHKYEPYQTWVERGIFVTKEYSYRTAYGYETQTKILVTGKGQIYLIEKLRSEFCKKENVAVVNQ